MTRPTRSATVRVVLANVENSRSTLTNVPPHGDVLLLNEVRPFRRWVKRWKQWRSRFADTNAIVWREGIEHVETWRRQILPAKRGRWQDSWAVASWLVVDGIDCLFVGTHFPSKAWTTMPWRRKGWRIAEDELMEFVDDVVAEIVRGRPATRRRPARAARPDLAGIPVVLGLDTNRGSMDWTFEGFDRTVAPVTYGRRGHYDQIFTRGPVELERARARRLGSPHRSPVATLKISTP